MPTKILIVDDQEALRKLVRMTLEGPDFTFQEAYTGDAALEMLDEFKPDMVILDVMMPGKHSGYEVCKIIKNTSAYYGIKVILLTARGQKNDLEEGLRVSADAQMIKPFSPAALLNKVKEVLILS